MKRYVYSVDIADLPASVQAFVEAITGMGAVESLDGLAFRYSVDAEDDFDAAEKVREIQACMSGEFWSFNPPMRPTRVMTERDIAEAERARRPGHRVPWSRADVVQLERGWRDPGLTVADIGRQMGRSRRSVESEAARRDLGPKARLNGTEARTAIEGGCVVNRCVWCRQVDYDGPPLPVEPCDDCRALETPEDITDAERTALVAYLEARS